MPSASWLSSNTGSIQSLRRLPSWCTLGPHHAIGNMARRHHWADSRPSTVSLLENNGPTLHRRPQGYVLTLAHPERSAVFILINTRPTPCHRQHGSAVTLGLLQPIDSIPCEKPWAHSISSAISLNRNAGPIHNNRQHHL
jgi:hypothetical protein